MSMKDELIKENKEFLNDWEVKRKVGFKKFLVTGFLKFALFATAIYLGCGVLNHKISMNSVDFMIIIGISIFAPILSWFINEYKYKQ